VTRRPPGSALQLLAGGGETRVWQRDGIIPQSELLHGVATAAALYCMLTDRVDRELLDAAPDLRVIATMAVGVDNIDLDECTTRGIPVGHTPDVLTATTADMAFGLLLGAARRLGEGIGYVKAGEWGDWRPDLLLGHDVHSSTLGIVGLGRIGAAVARRAVGFEMRVVYTGPRPKPGLEAELGVSFLDLGTLLAEADHVVITAPLNTATRGMINAGALARMKPTATIVNVARGALVDTVALVDALRRGTIAAAALDVTDPEPLPGDHPLLDLPNCIVTPHLGSSSAATRAAMGELTARNILAGLAGSRLPACANPAVYDP